MDERDKELDALRQLSADVGIPIVPLELQDIIIVSGAQAYRLMPTAATIQERDAQFLRSLRIEPMDEA